MTATTWRRIQSVHVLICLALIYPAITWWLSSIEFLVGISVWSLVGSALAGWMGARAEESAMDKSDLDPIKAALAQILARLPPT